MRYCFIALLSAFLVLSSTGCVKNQKKCLEKYGFKTCEEMKSFQDKNRDTDEAMQYHQACYECGCKCK